MSKQIYGNVSKDGKVYSGTGFTVVHDDTGEYSIVFLAPFSNIPSVVTLQNYPKWNDFNSSGGDTKDNSVLIAVNEKKFKVKTGAGGGDAQDRNFSFIAIGD